VILLGLDQVIGTPDDMALVGEIVRGSSGCVLGMGMGRRALDPVSTARRAACEATRHLWP
jgi:hypothetical protein